jgi:hypothetical protein
MNGWELSRALRERKSDVPVAVESPAGVKPSARRNRRPPESIGLGKTVRHSADNRNGAGSGGSEEWESRPTGRKAIAA